MTKHLLIVDDDALLRRSLAFRLEQAGFHASTAASAEAALQEARAQRPDLILLDIGLPGIDGLEALRYFREEIQVPVIFLTARRRELDEILGLELGADDYVTKPFDLDVLLAHIKAVLRRSGQPVTSERSEEPIQVGLIQVDPQARIARLGEQSLDLSVKEFDLLYALAARAGKVVPLQDLIDQVWGKEFIGQPQVVYVHIRWLRQKIELDPNHPQRIITIRGIGYRLDT